MRSDVRNGRVHGLSLAVLLVSATANAAYVGTGGLLNDAGEVDPGVTSFTINVTDAGTIGSFAGVTLSNLQHSWMGDLEIQVIAPDGDSISLVNRVGYPGALFGDSSNYFGNYTFANGGANLWAIATAQGNGSTFNIPSGTYAATGAGSGTPLDLTSFFLGRSAQGNWTLKITDYESGDIGNLANGWILDFTVVPAPGASLALIAAFAGVARRRRS